jgi:hypothetical protein
VACDAIDFIRKCRVLPDGFIGRSQAAWRLGTVLMLQHDGALAVVQKSANDPNYEFALAFSLPGGMVRSSDDAVEAKIETEKLLTHSLAVRALAEANISLDRCERLRIAAEFGPVVTSYTAKGAIRFTLIAVQSAVAQEATDLASRDRSVRDACWARPPFQWECFAPANRVLVAHALWHQLSGQDREAAVTPVEAAVRRCAAWGKEMGWGHLPLPWAATAEIEQWRMSWCVE